MAEDEKNDDETYEQGVLRARTRRIANALLKKDSGYDTVAAVSATIGMSSSVLINAGWLEGKTYRRFVENDDPGTFEDPYSRPPKLKARDRERKWQKWHPDYIARKCELSLQEWRVLDEDFVCGAVALMPARRARREQTPAARPLTNLEVRALIQLEREVGIPVDSLTRVNVEVADRVRVVLLSDRKFGEEHRDNVRERLQEMSAELFAKELRNVVVSWGDAFSDVSSWVAERCEWSKP